MTEIDGTRVVDQPISISATRHEWTQVKGRWQENQQYGSVRTTQRQGATTLSIPNTKGRTLYHRGQSEGCARAFEPKRAKHWVPGGTRPTERRLKKPLLSSLTRNRMPMEILPKYWVQPLLTGGGSCDLHPARHQQIAIYGDGGQSYPSYSDQRCLDAFNDTSRDLVGAAPPLNDRGGGREVAATARPRFGSNPTLYRRRNVRLRSLRCQRKHGLRQARRRNRRDG